jgi:HD-GYP domain-containing protein (c-di-GMP phosphodiesterase class II)
MYRMVDELTKVIVTRAPYTYQHHCHLDGSGYPNHAKGDNIILEARILCVADPVEAMSHNRHYRTSLGIDAALQEIEEGKNKRYDPIVVDACLKLFRVDRYAFPSGA